jgi:hypothetical protein
MRTCESSTEDTDVSFIDIQRELVTIAACHFTETACISGVLCGIREVAFKTRQTQAARVHHLLDPCIRKTFNDRHRNLQMPPRLVESASMGF